MIVTVSAALLAASLADTAFAGDKEKGKRGGDARYDHRDDRDRDRHDRDRRDHDRDRRADDYRVQRSGRYFRDRDVVVVREYYRPHYRALPRGVRYHYARHAHLPVGWERKIRPVPVYVERDLYPIPHGYRRGIIDGHLVVHNTRGLILDVAVLF
jgi:Ni/Co efflux regulator RcnB